MTYAARITALPLPPYDYTQMTVSFGEVGGVEHGYRAATVQSLLAAAAVIGYDADTELTALRARVGELERALQEADTIMGHDDSETEWREKWGALWVGAAINKGKL